MRRKCRTCNSTDYTDTLIVGSVSEEKLDESKLDSIGNFNIKSSRFRDGNLKGRLFKHRTCDTCDNKIGRISLTFPFMKDNYPGNSRKCPKCETTIINVNNMKVIENSGDFKVVMDGECINCGKSYQTIVLSDRKISLKYLLKKLKRKFSIF
jgi:hypothetical protein